MKKGPVGTSLGGGNVRTRKPKAMERNYTPCPVCGAGPCSGSPCFSRTAR